MRARIISVFLDFGAFIPFRRPSNCFQIPTHLFFPDQDAGSYHQHLDGEDRGTERQTHEGHNQSLQRHRGRPSGPHHNHPRYPTLQLGKRRRTSLKRSLRPSFLSIILSTNHLVQVKSSRNSPHTRSQTQKRDLITPTWGPINPEPSNLLTKIHDKSW